MKASKMIFVLTIVVALFWILGNSINVYAVAIVGAVFEILWLPMILLTFILPLAALVFWYKEKFAARSLNFYSLMIISAVILVAIFIQYY